MRVPTSGDHHSMILVPRPGLEAQNTKEIIISPLRGIAPNSEVKFDTFFRLKRAVRVPRCWEWILTIVTNILTQPSTNFKIFGSEVDFLVLILSKPLSEVGFFSKLPFPVIRPDLKNFPGTFRGTRDHKK